MRGADLKQGGMFSYVSPEERVPKSHPLRRMRAMVDKALAEMSPEFEAVYSKIGRPSIPPEKLLRALLLQILFTIRSERMLMEQLDYNLLFRWFVGLGMDDPVWDPTVFTKNRDRLLEGKIARTFFRRVLEQAQRQHFLSDEHFTVDGTLIEAWASQKSFQFKGSPPQASPPDDPGNPTVNFHGEKRSNDTHESKTDPQARQNRRLERFPILSWPPIPHSRLLDRHFPQRRLDGACRQVSVAHDDAVARVVDQRLVSRKVALNLGLDRRRQHLPRALPQHLGQSVPRHLSWEGNQVSDTLLHGGVPPAPSGGMGASSTPRVRRLPSSSNPTSGYTSPRAAGTQSSVCARCWACRAVDTTVGSRERRAGVSGRIAFFWLRFGRRTSRAVIDMAVRASPPSCPLKGWPAAVIESLG
jgi:transposase